MSGTSLDGIDGVRVRFTESGLELLQSTFVAYPKILKQRFSELTSARKGELHQSQVLGIEHSRLANEVVQKLCDNTNGNEVRGIGNHGQTIRHLPNISTPYSLQLGNGSLLAELSGITTVMDFRNRDIAAGGQGAPLAPAFHQAVFADTHERRAIVNIGGIANASILSSDNKSPLLGFDTGPGNALMDEWSARHINQPFDKNGEWAASGKINDSLLQSLMSEPFIKSTPPKSTGRDLFNLKWLIRHKEIVHIKPEDVQATLCQFTARSITTALSRFASESPEAIYICGGGAKNEHLLRAIQTSTETKVLTTTALCIKPQLVEACAFAWLAKQAIDGNHANAPSVTGARHPAPLGAIYPA